MCGLVTLISATPTHALGERANRMLEVIAHRGPDGRGLALFHCAEPCPPDGPADLALAHARLAIQDTSDAGLQPMHTDDGRFWLSYNGEIYNFRQLRSSLEALGHTFRSGCDTEVLLQLLAARGRAAIPTLDGQFAFCLFDRTENTLLLARDRFGIKPLYVWSPSPGSLCIASEIKAFTAHPEWHARLNRPRALDFLVRGLIDHVPGETMFEGVRQIPPGCSRLINLADPAAATDERWFDIATHAPPYPPDIGALLAESVRRRLVADVPVGSCLSGGIDSSAVVALASRAMKQHDPASSLQTIHARASLPELDESRYARAAADHAEAAIHEVVPEGSDLFDRLDELVWAQDEPFASPSIFAQFKVFELAGSLGLKVMLDGQGADEQLAGYHAFFKAALAEYFSRGRFAAAHVHAHGVKAMHGLGLVKQVAEATAALAPPAMRSRLRRAGLFRATDLSSGRCESWIDPFDAMPHGSRTVRGLAIDQLTRGSLPMLLHWEDRNSMHFGVEARVPFLDPDLVATSLALPTGDKIRRGVTKWALREAMRSTVPDLVLGRTDKVAFATPEKVWIRADARSLALLDQGIDAAAPFLTPDAPLRLRGMLNMTEGSAPYDNAVWRVICFGAWVERFGVEI